MTPDGAGWIPRSIAENLRFLILEVVQQLDRTRRCLREPDADLQRSILHRDDYVDQLKAVIKRKCFASGASTVAVDELRAIDVVTDNLERIADFCEKIVQQLGRLRSPQLLGNYGLDSHVDIVKSGASQVETAVLHHSTALALKICRVESQLDDLYAQTFAQILKDLEHGDDRQGLVTVLFIAHYLERMGDALLNIGEALLGTALGQPLKIEQARALEQTLRESGVDADLSLGTSETSLQAVGETRSGCTISRVTSSDPMIFKEGRSSKLIEERDGIELWNRVMPGLAPKILAFNRNGDQAAILLEHLTGQTYDQLILAGADEDMRQGMQHLTQTLRTVWEQTRRDAPVDAKFVKQMRSRLPDVYAVHPSFASVAADIGGVAVPGFDEQLAAIEQLQQDFAAPFSVLTHGDFNVDNVLYSPSSGAIHLIDLHRSKYFDYAQDVSVFLVSNLRMQVFDPPVRRRINWVIHSFMDFAQSFAHASSDTSFPLRLGLGLARSLVTSTRFILDRKFANRLFLRSKYLTQSILDHGERPAAEFRIPQEVFLD